VLAYLTPISHFHYRRRRPSSAARSGGACLPSMATIPQAYLFLALERLRGGTTSTLALHLGAPTVQI
jgi:hypothetical protein